MTPLPPDRWCSGFYLNELLLKLFARHDSHPDVFALYAQTMDDLKREDAIRPLRLFEKRLLEAIGYGLALERDAHDGAPIDPDASYHYRIEQGAVRVEGVAEGAVVYSGATFAVSGLARSYRTRRCAPMPDACCVPPWTAAWTARELQQPAGGCMLAFGETGKNEQQSQDAFTSV